ncbi:propionate catabolism operon regulatory protein PrpR [Massilia sp. W12]|uniref:propionate catabolism operon regulatory protein PrpR n=1 Tax=Massilia sp. W12 TaxID=3126507 RepID=UPI0030CB86A4
MQRASDHKPVIWTVAVSRLFSLLREITLEFDGQATIEPIKLGFEEAVQWINEKLETRHCDAIIAAGSNGAYLKSRLAAPVIIIKASGFDVMQALSRARTLSLEADGALAPLGIISYLAPFPEVAEFARSFGIELLERTYATVDDARAGINELKARGVRAVVGTGLITDLAQAAGMQGVFVYSADSARQAFEHALQIARLRPGKSLPAAVTQPGLQVLRGNSAALDEARQLILLYARSPATVLIEAETGCGKELAARAIHGESQRLQQKTTPFVAVNCGALAESLLEAELFGYEDGAFTGSRRGGHAGLFEAAHGGALFLDEIGEMPLALQTRLLRVLEERAVLRVGATKPIALQVRVICATHSDLAALVAQGRFRADLYYRLAVLRLHLPPLRARGADVLDLAAWCLKNALAGLDMRGSLRANLEAELASCASLLQAYAWPGNVRELRNVMERLALHLAAQPLQAITPALLLRVAPELQAALPGATPLPAPSLSAQARSGGDADLALLLNRFGGNRALLAQHLGISRTTLWRRLKQAGLAQ